MRYVIGALLVTFAAAAPALAQSENQVATGQPTQVPAAVASPSTPPPAMETKQGSATFGGSGLMLNTNSLLGIRPRQ